jgi:two-component system NtrC family sensor kinase
MLLENIISIFILRYLQKRLPDAEAYLKWGKILKIGMVLAVIFIILSYSPIGIRVLIHGLSLALVGVLIYGVFKVPEFNQAKTIAYAVLPYLGVSLVSEVIEIISPSFFQSIEALLDTAGFFAFLWAVALWYLSRKQKKALELERLKAEEREKELRLTEKIKTQLEKDVAQRTLDLVKKKEALEKALNELKATQDQLILAEKMASLGELTAGIAHEIQNPLNFVNNFAEVSNELIQELKDEIKKGDGQRDKENEEDLMEDIAQNLEKITFHGKRAEAIVKSMLQHSRKDNGKREPTDLNKLAEEYLRLSYHGLRAKDKSFNADFKLELDENLPMVEVVPQEMGRVLLNLINNAFYAAAEKKKFLEEKGEGKDFKPTVLVTTSLDNKRIKISVKDNGNGIPEEVKNKIFQPFFTTKPAGVGTGLGLSMSYDIITKGHGGDLSVQSEPGAYSEFIIHLSLN